jgi:putative lipoprotein
MQRQAAHGDSRRASERPDNINTPPRLQWLWDALAALVVCGFLSLVLMFGTPPAHASCPDDLVFRADKQKHFAGSVLMAGAGATATGNMLAGFLASAAVGAGIELNDSKHPGKCGSWQDFAYDLAGSLVGVAGQHWLIGPNRIFFHKEF